MSWGGKCLTFGMWPCFPWTHLRVAFAREQATQFHVLNKESKRRMRICYPPSSDSTDAGTYIVEAPLGEHFSGGFTGT